MVRINHVKFGEVKVDGVVHYSDVIVCWDGKVEYVPKDRFISPYDMKKILSRKPTDLVIGVGIVGAVRVSEEALSLARKRRIDVFIELSGKAMQIFNGLIADKKKAVAVIHTTG